MTPEKWQSLSLCEQLGNIGSEISRAYYWEQKSDSTAKDNSLLRALALIDLTLDDRRHAGRLKEIARLREVAADFLSTARNYQIGLFDLEKFLTDYALLARR